MRQAYSEYRIPKYDREQMQRLTKIFGAASDVELGNQLRRMAAECNSTTDVGERTLLAESLFRVRMGWKLFKGKGKHYFLAAGLGEFLQNAIHKYSKEMLKAVRLQREDIGQADAVLPILLHFPKVENRASLCISCDERTSGGKIVAVMCNENSAIFTEDSLVDGVGFIDSDGNTVEDASAVTAAIRLVLGFFLYIDAFPDTVVPAGQGDVVDWNHFDRTGKTKHIVHKSEELLMEERLSVNPHYRKGHLRFLMSERFVHMRGQSVWVKGTFVKGQAFDVLDDTPAEVAAKP